MSNSAISQRTSASPLEILIAVLASATAAAGIGLGAALLEPLVVLIAVLACAAILAVRLAPVTAVIILTAIRGAADALNGMAGLNFGGVALDPVDAVTGAFTLGAVWWLIGKIREGARPGKAALILPALVFGALAGLSLLHSPGFLFGMKDLSKLAAVFAAFMILVVERPSRNRLMLILAATTFGSILPMTVGILDFLQGEGMNFEEQAGLRIQSVFSHPNTYGLYLVAVVVAAWSYARESDGWRRAAAGAIGIAAIASLVLPLSRSAWLAFGAVVISVAVRYPKVFLYLGIGVAIAATLQPRLVERALDLGESGAFEAQNSVDIRLDAWGEALDVWERNPILGTGWGSFEALTGGGFVHNDYVRTFVELGPVGAIAFVALMAALLRSAYRAMVGRRDMPLAFFGFAVGYVIVAGVTNAFEKAPYQWYFWVLAGTALVWGNATGSENRPKANSPEAG